MFIYDFICSSTCCGITKRMREGGDSKCFLISDWYDILTCKKRWCRVNEANKDIFWTTVRWKWIPPFLLQLYMYFPSRRTNSPTNKLRYLSVGRKNRPGAIFPSDGRIDSTLWKIQKNGILKNIFIDIFTFFILSPLILHITN